MLLGVLFFLVLGEAYFRIQYGIAFRDTKHSWNLYDEEKGWALRPGKYTHFEAKILRVVDVYINELGLRNRPLSLESPAGKKRVSVIGDSMTFAAALNEGKRFSDQLQEFVKPRYEIVNISVPGYGTGQQFRLLEELVTKGYDLGAKVILIFFPNDLQDNLGLKYSSLERNSKRPAFSIDLDGELSQTVPASAKKSSNRSNPLNNSLFYLFARSQIEALVVTYPILSQTLDAIGLVPDFPRVPGIIARWYGPDWKKRWSATEDILNYFAGKIRRDYRDIEFYIAFIPSPIQTEIVFKDIISNRLNEDFRYKEFLLDLDRPQRMLRQFCEEHDIPFIDTTPALRKSTFNYFPREGHLNESGSTIVARVLYDSVFE